MTFSMVQMYQVLLTEEYKRISYNYESQFNIWWIFSKLGIPCRRLVKSLLIQIKTMHFMFGSNSFPYLSVIFFQTWSFQISAVDRTELYIVGYPAVNTWCVKFWNNPYASHPSVVHDFADILECVDQGWVEGTLK